MITFSVFIVILTLSIILVSVSKNNSGATCIDRMDMRSKKDYEALPKQTEATLSKRKKLLKLASKNMKKSWSKTDRKKHRISRRQNIFSLLKAFVVTMFDPTFGDCIDCVHDSSSLIRYNAFISIDAMHFYICNI